MDHETTAPPPVVGVMDVIATPFVRIDELVLYVTVGAATFTAIVTVAVALPPLLVAVTVYVVDELIEVGVPEIAPVDVEKARPAGNVGEIDHEITVPPVEVGVDVVMSASLVKLKEVGV